MSRRGTMVVLALAATLLQACVPSAANHEELGDRAYVAGNHDEALTEYRLAVVQAETPSARLRAKAASAALRAGDLAGAAAEYAALGRADGARVDEAADGLERVARGASEAGDRPALQAALAGLRELAPGRALGALALQLARTTADAAPADQLAVLPLAAANAPDARAEDSLMYAYGQALVRVGRCDQAVAIFEGLVRRQRATGVLPGATAGALSCAVRLGRADLQGGRLERAEDWFRRAVVHGDDSPLGRSAYLGLGDVMVARGDLVGAAEAFQRVLADALPGDSVAAEARERLNRLANAGTVFP